MRVSNIVAVVVLAGAGVWAYQNRGRLFSQAGSPDAGRTDSVSQHNAAVEAAGQEASRPAAGGSVTENMTPDQVRSLLGPPDDVESSANDLGKPVEKWTYRKAGKVVTFVDGVAVSVGPN